MRKRRKAKVVHASIPSIKLKMIPKQTNIKNITEKTIRNTFRDELLSFFIISPSFVFTISQKCYSFKWNIRRCRMWNNLLRKLWNIAPLSQCEMKFAFSHLQSKYFTAKLFHLAKPNFTRRRRISLKKALLSQCFFLC